MPRFVHDFSANINLQPASNSRAFHAKRPHSRWRNHPGDFFALADRNQLAGVAVEHFAAVFGDQHEVLDAHAELAGQVDARLDGEHHARLHRRVVRGRHVAGLVHVEADLVSQAMREVGAVARLFDD